MRVIISFTVLAASIAICYTAPTLAPNDVDWTHVSNLITTIRNDAKTLFENIKTASDIAEDPVKDSIFQKVDAANNQTNQVVNQTAVYVSHQTLSRKHANYLEIQLNSTSDNLLENLQVDFEQLQPVLANLITRIINNATIDISKLSQELYVILPINWDNVGEVAKFLQTDILLAAMQQIVTTAKNDNEEVGAIIEEMLGPYTEVFTFVFEILRVRIDDQSLNEEYTREYYFIVEQVHGTMKIDLSPEIAKLSPDVSEQIREILLSSLQEIAENIEKIVGLVRS